MGFKLFVHSVGMVLSNFGAALRISGLLYLISFVLGLPLLLNAARGQVEGGFGGLELTVAIITVPLFLWIAVGWHRFILLDETPGALLPRFKPGHVLTYFGCALLVMITGVPVVLGTAVLGFIAYFLGVHPGLFFALMPAAYVAILVIGYRFGAILPATAVDRPLPLGQAWSATRDATGAIVVLAILSGIAAFLLDYPANLLAPLPFGSMMALAWLVLSGWLKTMVGVSILTTIYGHYVEGRPIG